MRVPELASLSTKLDLFNIPMTKVVPGEQDRELLRAESLSVLIQLKSRNKSVRTVIRAQEHCIFQGLWRNPHRREDRP